MNHDPTRATVLGVVANGNLIDSVDQRDGRSVVQGERVTQTQGPIGFAQRVIGSQVYDGYQAAPRDSIQ